MNKKIIYILGGILVLATVIFALLSGSGGQFKGMLMSRNVELPKIDYSVFDKELATAISDTTPLVNKFCTYVNNGSKSFEDISASYLKGVPSPDKTYINCNLSQNASYKDVVNTSYQICKKLESYSQVQQAAKNHFEANGIYGISAGQGLPCYNYLPKTDATKYTSHIGYINSSLAYHLNYANGTLIIKMLKSYPQGNLTNVIKTDIANFLASLP